MDDQPLAEDALAASLEVAECECGSWHPSDIIAELRRRGFDVLPIEEPDR